MGNAPVADLFGETDRIDGVNQRGDGRNLPDLVPLKVTDKVPADRFAYRLMLRCKFLRVIFADIGDASLNRGPDRFRRMSLGNPDYGYRIRIPPAPPACLFHAHPDVAIVPRDRGFERRGNVDRARFAGFRVRQYPTSRSRSFTSSRKT